METRQPSTDQVFGALSNPTRRGILDLLLAGPETAQAIADRFDLSRPSVSEHLAVLRNAGLVRAEKDGRFQRYSIVPAPLHEVQAWLNPYERFWRERAADLGHVLNELEQEQP
jgi:DNA-binding transcriptional ArsR family regulator